MSRKPPESLPSFKRQQPFVSHENEPTLNETVRKRNVKQKNADQRFNSPFGFHEPKYKKVSILNRYPILFRRVFVTTSLLIFFRYKDVLSWRMKIKAEIFLANLYTTPP